MKTITVCVLLSLVLVTLVSGDEARGEPRVIQLPQGAVRGYKETGDNFFSFYGIPYATAPTGPNKFKAPLPAPTWGDTLEATNKDLICPQAPALQKMSNNKRNIIVTENCLVVNVFTPDTESKNLPVVVYVHGGAFQMGYSTMILHSSFVKSGKVIEVNFNYRLGVHGFLCLGTEDAPGNAGMKDQVAALRWVKANIATFGGNPDDVTIAGFSAGSVAVELLMLSESAQGLFNKVIPESGAAVGVWSVQIDPLATAKDFALANNFTNVDDIYALEHFYKTISLDVLLADDFMSSAKDGNFQFVPCIERVTSEESFLTDAPVNIIKKGNFKQLPLLIGFSNMEGMLWLPFFETWKEQMNEKFSDFLPADLEFRNEKEKEEVAKVIKEFYFGDKPVGFETVEDYILYYSDVLFAYPTLRSVKLNLQSGADSIYLYQYSYVEETAPTLYNVKGADHCAQSIALGEGIFNLLFNIQNTENYKTVKEMMSNLWLNFIITGKPVPKESPQFQSGWPAISEKNSAYMELNLTPDLHSGLLKKREEFWDNIYRQYYRVPVPPPAPKQQRTEL